MLFSNKKAIVSIAAVAAIVAVIGGDGGTVVSAATDAGSGGGIRGGRNRKLQSLDPDGPDWTTSGCRPEIPKSGDACEIPSGFKYKQCRYGDEVCTCQVDQPVFNCQPYDCARKPGFLGPTAPITPPVPTPPVQPPVPVPTDAPDGDLKDIPSTAQELGFTTLNAALTAADLVGALSDPPNSGPFTVFAPTNEAFGAVPKELLDCLLLPENKGVLSDILLYHVANGKVLSSDLTDGQTIRMLDGQDTTISINGDVVKIDDSATVIGADELATNGVIHAIDSVLVPFNIDVSAFLETCSGSPTGPTPTNPPNTEPTNNGNPNCPASRSDITDGENCCDSIPDGKFEQSCIYGSSTGVEECRCAGQANDAGVSDCEVIGWSCITISGPPAPTPPTPQQPTEPSILNPDGLCITNGVGATCPSGAGFPSIACCTSDETGAFFNACCVENFSGISMGGSSPSGNLQDNEFDIIIGGRGADCVANDNGEGCAIFNVPGNQPSKPYPPSADGPCVRTDDPSSCDGTHTGTCTNSVGETYDVCCPRCATGTYLPGDSCQVTLPDPAACGYDVPSQAPNPSNPVQPPQPNPVQPPQPNPVQPPQPNPVPTPNSAPARIPTINTDPECPASRSDITNGANCCDSIPDGEFEQSCMYGDSVGGIEECRCAGQANDAGVSDCEVIGWSCITIGGPPGPTPTAPQQPTEPSILNPDGLCITNGVGATCPSGAGFPSIACCTSDETGAFFNACCVENFSGISFGGSSPSGNLQDNEFDIIIGGKGADCVANDNGQGCAIFNVPGNEPSTPTQPFPPNADGPCVRTDNPSSCDGTHTGTCTNSVGETFDVCCPRCATGTYLPGDTCQVILPDPAACGINISSNNGGGGGGSVPSSVPPPSPAVVMPNNSVPLGNIGTGDEDGPIFDPLIEGLPGWNDDNVPKNNCPGSLPSEQNDEQFLKCALPAATKCCYNVQGNTAIVCQCTGNFFFNQGLSFECNQGSADDCDN